MVVAEQPGVTDDAYGRAFSGRGLKEIRKYMEEQGIDAHYTYALKCTKPDKDTKPKPKHIKICRTEYLVREIAAVKPKHIIVLGSQAITAVIGKARKLSEVQGTRFKDEKLNAWIYPTIHYAQALYSKENEVTMWADIKMYIKWIKGGKKEMTKFDPPVYCVSTLKGLRNMARKIQRSGGVAACDIETMGLNPYRADKDIRTIQFCWDPEMGGVCVPMVLEPDCYYTDPTNVAERFWKTKEEFAEAIKILRKILFNTKLIWHNGKFDRIWLWMWGKRNFGRPIKCPQIFMDTMHVAYLLNENRAMGLKRLITSELGFPSYNISDKMTKDLDLLIPYSTKDTVACFLLARKYAGDLRVPGMERLKSFYFNVMRRADALYTKMEIRGWPVAEEEARKVKNHLDDLLTEAQESMHEVLAKHKITVDTKTFGSNPKLIKLIWGSKEEGGLGLTPNPDKSVAYTDKGKGDALAVSEDALIHVKSHPFVTALLNWRSISKALSTYATPMLHAAETRGKLTTSYKLAKVVTGRTASGKEEGVTGAQSKTAEGMNLQNIPYDKPGAMYGIKNIIQCPDSEDEWIMECDFSQVELRVAGELSKDRVLLWAYDNGIDLHTYRAKRVMGLDDEGWAKLTPEEQDLARQRAKPVNFGYLYGMSWYKFRQFALVQYEIDFTADEARQSREIFFSDHAGLEKWYGKQERMCLRLGYVETLSGRRRHLPDIYLDPDKGREAKSKYKDAVRQAINSPVQGFASDLKLMAAIEIDMALDPRKAKLFGEVHDSVLLRVKKWAILETAAIVLPIMRHPRLLDILGIELKVPIEADVKVGPTLGYKKAINKWPEFANAA